MADPKQQEMTDSERSPDGLHPGPQEPDDSDESEGANSRESAKADKPTESPKSRKPTDSQKVDKPTESPKADKPIGSGEVAKPTEPSKPGEALVDDLFKQTRVSMRTIKNLIRDDLAKIKRARGRSVEYAIRLGGRLDYLKTAKDSEGRRVVERGAWEAWLRQEFDLSKRTADDYMDLYRNQDLALRHKEKGISGALEEIRKERGVKHGDKRSRQARKERATALSDDQESTAPQLLKQLEAAIQEVTRDKHEGSRATRLAKAANLAKVARQRVEATPQVPEGVYQFVLNFTSKREYEELVDAVRVLQREWELDSQEAVVHYGLAEWAQWVRDHPGSSPFDRIKAQMRRSPERLPSPEGGTTRERGRRPVDDAATPPQEEGRAP